MAAAKKSLKENGAKAVKHGQGSQHQRLLDSPFGATTTVENGTIRGGFTVDSGSVDLEAASSSAADPAVHVPPTNPEPAFHAVNADAKPTPKLAPANNKAKSKTAAKTGAKGAD